MKKILIISICALLTFWCVACKQDDEKVDNADIIDSLTLIEQGWIKSAVPLSEFFGYDQLAPNDFATVVRTAKDSNIDIIIEDDNIVFIHSKYNLPIQLGNLVASPFTNMILFDKGILQYSLADDKVFQALYMDVWEEDFLMFIEQLEVSYNKNIYKNDAQYSIVFSGENNSGTSVMATHTGYTMILLYFT